MSVRATRTILSGRRREPTRRILTARKKQALETKL